MAVYKCKMCGGDLDIAPGITVAECEYCGTKQTLPKANEEVVRNLFNRANALRLKCEFDKAEQIYEKIVQEDNTESEAHWGIVLCKYGIEYVEDPKTYKRIPTCHRTSYDAVTADPDYLAAIEYADATQRHLYEAEAKAIDQIQKNILTIVKEEKPFDVFLCYKETDENGKRTIDSSIANDIYHQLTQEGLKVFYAAITLEDKLGEAYEPYIFAALNSAKVMLVIGTKPEYFTAVWVKNEWSRFLKLIKTDRSKLLIPCYKDMDAYELPEEFSHLQAQDLSKIGFINDVVRGIKKVTVKDEPKTAATKETIAAADNANIAPLLERAFMFLEDGEWDRADEFCEQVLNLDPRNAKAYVGKLMAELHCKKQEDLQNVTKLLDANSNFQRAIHLCDENLKAVLNSYVENNKILYARTKRKKKIALIGAAVLSLAIAFVILLNTVIIPNINYNDAVALMKAGKYEEAIIAFENMNAYKDSTDKIQECKYKQAIVLMESEKYEEAIAALQALNNYKDSTDKITICRNALRKTGAVKETISAGYHHTVGLIANGMVVATGDKTNGQCDVGSWSDIIAISAGWNHTVGLKSNGTVVAKGNNENGECNIGGWTDIIAISAGNNRTIGLKANGTVVAKGNNDNGECNVNSWTDIIAISAGGWHTVGLKADGTVVAVGSNDGGECDVYGWTDIVAISAGGRHTIGLKADGTVVATGYNRYYQCDVSDWTDIIAISAGGEYTVGLRADGTVVAVGHSGAGQCDVSAWKNITAVSAGWCHTIGLKADGTSVAVGDNGNGKRNISNWTNIKVNK